MTYEYYGPGLGSLGTNGDTTPPGSIPGPSSTEQPETMFEQGWEWFRDVVGSKNDQQAPSESPAATGDGKPTAAGFSEYAREVAVREVATVDEEQAPIQETPSGDGEPGDSVTTGGDDTPWFERYQTHITIASTLIGLGTFIIWLMLRKKD